MAGKIAIDASKCNGCMLCLHACMLGNFKPGPDGKVYPAEGLDCFSCGHCIAACPTQAMSHADLSPGELLDEGARPSYEQFIKFLKMRRSRREFKDEPVPKEVIGKLLAAAIEAPSSLNNQTVEYTVLMDRAVLKEISDRSAHFFLRMEKAMKGPVGKLIFRTTAKNTYEELEKLLPIMDSILSAHEAGRDLLLYDAPCAIMLHAPKTDMYAAEDANFSAENILLAAETLDLGACVIGLVTEPANRDPEIKRLAMMPLDHRVYSTIAIGYPRFKYKKSVRKNPPKVKFV